MSESRKVSARKATLWRRCDDGDNYDSSSSGSQDSLDNDDGSGAAASKPTIDGTTAVYQTTSAVEKFNETDPEENRVNWWGRFTVMAAPGSWLNKMKIHQFRSRVPATIRDWYDQLPKSTRRNWKRLSTKFHKLYYLSTGSYAE
ncbi:hypothetical protein PHMEG_00012153 [Phytophthora megakarya]|uniref:Eukaryotic/viral aspartic protease n=1 Tax=Phytophthora megakarya TaxID=4795 RepID=A0A225WC17_9STRA|nr:hypothetical protein PHMEG_00012153 [Phytophthora megakarya]